MGTVRAWLRDDMNTVDWLSRKSQQVHVPTYTHDDPIMADGPRVNPILTVLGRIRSSFDDDGVPQFDWVEIVKGEAILWEVRKEFDAESGFTHILGKTTMRYTGQIPVTETAMVTDDAGGNWRITKVFQKYGNLVLLLTRIVDR